MPSPFPGMNPFLEQDDVQHDFHEKFLPAMAARLVPQVRPNYIVKLEENLCVHEPEGASRRLLGRAIVGVIERSETYPAGGSHAIGLLDAPSQVELPIQDLEHPVYIEIRDRHSRNLITVVELLNPSNKYAGPGREQYLAKRARVLASRTNLVEIDLLRGGRLMPADGRKPSDYSVVVSWAGDRPTAACWPVSLRERLPVVPIPLRAGDPDASIDLQSILDDVYDQSGYEDYIYEGDPSPPLSAEDFTWSRSLLNAEPGTGSTAP